MNNHVDIDQTSMVLLYAFLILALKFFICLSFGTLYVFHVKLFESSFLGKSYGVVNILSRIALLSAPMVAEMDSKTSPLIILLVINVLAIVATALLRPSK